MPIIVGLCLLSAGHRSRKTLGTGIALLCAYALGCCVPFERGDAPVRKSAWIYVFALALMFAYGALAKTPDGKPPSVETICDNEQGAAFGLCNAYCEAMDCLDPNQHASDQGCESVRRNFEKKTGRPLPCTLVCSCPGLNNLSAQITAGAVVVNQCVMVEGTLFLQTTAGPFTIGGGGVQENCGPNGQPAPGPLGRHEPRRWRHPRA